MLLCWVSFLMDLDFDLLPKLAKSNKITHVVFFFLSIWKSNRCFVTTFSHTTIHDLSLIFLHWIFWIFYLDSISLSFFYFVIYLLFIYFLESFGFLRQSDVGTIPKVFMYQYFLVIGYRLCILWLLLLCHLFETKMIVVPNETNTW